MWRSVLCFLGAFCACRSGSGLGGATGAMLVRVDEGRYRTGLMLASLAWLTTGGCGGGSGDDGVDFEGTNASAYVYTVPVHNGDGWPTAHLDDVGIDDQRLADLMENIRSGNGGYRYIDSVLIAKDGQLVFHELTRTELDTFDARIGNDDLDLHTMRSVSKSFVSALVGIAIDQGYLPDVGLHVHDYFSDKAPIGNFTPEKATATLSDWLTMRHGYQWNEDPPFDADNDFERLQASSDPLQLVLDRPMASAPGGLFVYSSGVSYALGGLLERSTGASVASFAEQTLFQPLGIHNYRYFVLDDQLDTSAGLLLTTRDMAKLGQLFLDGGLWNGQQVVSDAWVERSTRRHVAFGNGVGGYGFHWWTLELNHRGTRVSAYYADGFGGQYVVVVPALGTVVALTGSAYDEEAQAQRARVRVVEDFVLTSIR